jgi:hypothetical protein
MGDVVSRRAMLGGSVATLGLVAFGIAAPEAEASAKNGPRPAAKLAPKAAPGSSPLREDYTPAIGRVFTVTRAGHTYRVRLTHIQDLSPTSAKLRPHCFAMIFAPVGKVALKDGIYVLRRSGVRTHKLFLSAVGTKRGMQAIINRSH